METDSVCEALNVSILIWPIGVRSLPLRKPSRRSKARYVRVPSMILRMQRGRRLIHWHSKLRPRIKWRDSYFILRRYVPPVPEREVLPPLSLTIKEPRCSQCTHTHTPSYKHSYKFLRVAFITTRTVDLMHWFMVGAYLTTH